MFALTFLLFCLASKTVLGQYGFVYPNATDPNQSNLVFVLGQSLDIQWNSPFEAIKLAFIAENGPVFQFFSQNNTGDAYTWAVNVNNSDSTTPYYYLYFENEADNAQHYYSALFRVDSPVDAQSSATNAATVTVTPSPTIQASASTNGATTVFVTQAITSSTAASSIVLNPDASSASSNSGSGTGATAAGASSTGTSSPSGSVVPVNNGLSQGAKIGIGVGVPLGVIALVGIGFLAVWRSKRRSKASRADAVGAGVPGIQQTPGSYAGYGAGAGQEPSAFVQHSNKLSNNQHAYSPVQQQVPMTESGGLHELASRGANVGPHEMDSGVAGFRGYR